MNNQTVPATKPANEAPDLRSWLRQLSATDRLAVAQPGISLTDDLAAVAKTLERGAPFCFPRRIATPSR